MPPNKPFLMAKQPPFYEVMVVLCVYVFVFACMVYRESERVRDNILFQYLITGVIFTGCFDLHLNRSSFEASSPTYLKTKSCQGKREQQMLAVKY